MASRIRKFVYELNARDFEAHPCWVYAADEEYCSNQDESTVRPLRLEELPAEPGQVFVQAVFLFPNGRVRLGMVTLNAGDDPSGHQPALFLESETLLFYNGSSAPGRSEVEAFTLKLAEICPNPFPIQYISALRSTEGVPLAFGELSGVYWLADWRSGELRAET